MEPPQFPIFQPRTSEAAWTVGATSIPEALGASALSLVILIFYWLMTLYFSEGSTSWGVLGMFFPAVATYSYFGWLSFISNR